MTVEVSETYRYELRACGRSVSPPRSFLAPTKVLCTKHPEEVRTHYSRSSARPN
jgi:hypothetical protein